MSILQSHLLGRLINNQKGVSAILVAIVLPVLLGFTALAIDVGYMYATRNELQNIADGAALAGASELGRIYLEDVLNENHHSYVLSSDDESLIKDAAKLVASKNNAAGKSIIILGADILIGVWDFEETDPSAALAVTTTSPDAVRVIARRDASQNGPVTTFFASIFSIFGGSHETFEASARATAALSGIGTVDPGVLEAPFGISEHHDCGGEFLQLSPTTDSCAGWHNFFDGISASAAADKMIGLIRGFGPDSNGGKSEGDLWLETHFNIKSNQLADSEITPETSAGDSFEFQGGEIQSLFASGDYYESWDDENTPVSPSDNKMEKPIPFLTLFDFFRFRDEDDNGSNINACGESFDPDDIWTTTIPIYAEVGDTCSNPNQDREIVGFAKVRISMPNPNRPNDDVKLCYDCDWIYEPGRGSGNNLGNVKGSIPNLVE